MDHVKTDATTSLLLRWRQGDEDALGELAPLVYDELRSLARRYLSGERKGHTLEATDLVHEAFTRLIRMDVDWNDRAHFFAVAAGAMRRILVDHAKAKRRLKRGGGAAMSALDEGLTVAPEPPDDLVELDAALDRLATLDERKSRTVELHYFGGLTYDEIAVALGISRATVKRDLRLARAWLFHDLTGTEVDAT